MLYVRTFLIGGNACSIAIIRLRNAIKKRGKFLPLFWGGGGGVGNIFLRIYTTFIIASIKKYITCRLKILNHLPLTDNLFILLL
jgi:hypothetical protein